MSRRALGVLFKKNLTDDPNATHRLPNTIRDAIVIARYRFLWVDALCIVQDSPDDLALQLAQMDRIYGLAALTLAARGSTSSDSGIPGISVPRNMYNDTYTEMMVHNELNLGFWDPEVLGEYRTTDNESADNTSYIWRGWTFQEQAISIRILEFGHRRLSFSCGRWGPTGQLKETGCRHISSQRNPYSFKSWFRLLEQKTVENPDTKWFANADTRVRDWGMIRECYSARSFSHPIDRIRAITGAAKMFNRVIGMGIDNGGHARESLYRELLWHRDALKIGLTTCIVASTPDAAPEGMFPSWSWLSVWPVCWPGPLTPYPEVGLKISGGTELINNSLLEIEAPAITLRLIETSDKPTPKLFYPDGTLVNARLLLDKLTTNATYVICVPMAQANFGVSMGDQCGLLLLHLEDGQYYRRLGIGIVSVHSSEPFFDHFRLYAQQTRPLCN
ncbi:hypothetical protein PT974_09713 [Cladobotryum mycophilum]|uniref:Heterokaryon incompatibility domain-containing protein n=1 Tax=Cladobotryum mycophilum TaxID=491253 RepID=A0ABR0SIA2_9HYPO